MTTIPDYITLMALQPTRIRDAAVDRPATQAQALPSVVLSLRMRLARRFRSAAASQPALATPETVTPMLRDYPYRAGC